MIQINIKQIISILIYFDTEITSKFRTGERSYAPVLTSTYCNFAAYKTLILSLARVPSLDLDMG